jgi:UDP-N-acetylmuramoyl-tripeptide--D-alanyl-D-alanine ligase
MFQIYQLSSYKTRGVFNWFRATKFDWQIRYFALAFLSGAGMFVFVACFGDYEHVRYLGSLIFAALSGLFVYASFRQKIKTPLKFTPRAIRVVILSFILFTAAAAGLVRLGSLFAADYSLAALSQLFIPVIVALAHLIMAPFERLNNYAYKRRAVKKLESMPGLVKIGITGSYGKTTAKAILAKMLEKRYKVAASPASYNTPMGVSLAVNGGLMPDDEIFIAEMGARNVGDIRELALMIQPNYALLTAIGSQHLETFGSAENIAKTKYELIENMAPGGLAVFNGGDDGVIALYNRCGAVKRLTGPEGLSGAAAVYKNVVTGGAGTNFDIVIAEKTVRIKTALLGRHIPGLILACAALAYALGVKLEQIAEAAAELEPVPHRLQLIENGDTTVIDDAYNSNPEGSKNALEILSGFDGARIIVTPGMVELGEAENEANEQLGAYIAKYADYAFLVGWRGAVIKKGALAAGMAADKIITAPTLDAAVAALGDIPGKKAVLFENDLPDNY